MVLICNPALKRWAIVNNWEASLARVIILSNGEAALALFEEGA
jgi:hypothetical protein